MTTLKEHEEDLSNWLAEDFMAPSTKRLATILHDLLLTINKSADLPNKNDALLARDLKACAPQNASESARIRELEETARQLREQNANLLNRQRELNAIVDSYEGIIRERNKWIEQAGVRKEDTQIQDDGWIEWGGGDDPENPGVKVDVKWSNGSIDCGSNAGRWRWYNIVSGPNIIAYRVVKP